MLLTTPTTYRASAFMSAAEGLGLDVVQALDLPEQLAEYWRVPLGVPFNDPERAVEAVVEYAGREPVLTILSLDDGAALIAAEASARLGLPHNSPDSALAARDKGVMRDRLREGGAPVPVFRRYSLSSDPGEIAREVGYPCVLKPLRLSGSRGVMRADDPEQLIVAFQRLGKLLLEDGAAPDSTDVLVEDFIPGVEVALEGLLTGGSLQVLALFDKPDPLDGPYFEETIYVTPSRLPEDVQASVASCTALAASALGLREGPVHAELRVNDAGPWIVEIAGRSIGGLCSTVLRFGAGMCLEELILRHAVGLPVLDAERERAAAGVMMIPIPAAGMLTGVEGVEGAREVEGIVDVQITARLHRPLVPLPEGASYLGFIFARADGPATVEAALRRAHSLLRFEIRPHITLRETKTLNSRLG